VQQVRQHQSGRSCADDPHLSAHVGLLSGGGGGEGLGDPVGGEPGGVGLVVGVDVLDAAFPRGEDLELAFGAVRGLS
jgi:hypothetical protein